MNNQKNGYDLSDIIMYVILGITAIVAVILGVKLGIETKLIFYIIVAIEFFIYVIGSKILNKIKATGNDGKEANEKVDGEISQCTDEMIVDKTDGEKYREYAELAAQKLVRETEIPYFNITLLDEKPDLLDSKVGGIPYLPREFEIPLDSDGNQMKLLAQINCKDIAGLDDYPNEGILQFWLTTKWDWMEAKTVYHREINCTVTEYEVMNRIAEFNRVEMKGFPVEGEYKMSFRLSKESMSQDDYRLKALFCQYYSEISGEEISDPEDSDSEKVYQVYETECLERKGGEGIGHKVSGYHYTTQYDPSICNVYVNEIIDIHSDDAELLLFQLDSDYAPVNFETRKHDWIKVMWGDAGVGRFYIKRSDLKKCAFENTWYSWDCS